jgi:hypothetical protein
MVYGNPMSGNKRNYAVGRGKPPVPTRFKKGQSGNPREPHPKNLPALLIEALDEPMTATIDGERREITKRQAVVTQLVNKSAAADLRATKMLVEMLKDARKKPASHRHPSPPPSPRRRGGHGDLHRQDAPILGGGSSPAFPTPTRADRWRRIIASGRADRVGRGDRRRAAFTEDPGDEAVDGTQSSVR